MAGEEQWLFACGIESGLIAINSNHRYVEALDLPWPVGDPWVSWSRSVVLSAEKSLGLLLVANEKLNNLCVGNPLLANWKKLELPAGIKVSDLVGAAITTQTATKFGDYRLTVFAGQRSQTEASSLEVLIFDSETESWSRGAGHAMQAGSRIRQLCATSDARKAYFAYTIDGGLALDAYNLETGVWESAAEKLQTDQSCPSWSSNHSRIVPTLVACDSGLYCIGRTWRHRHIRVWRLDLSGNALRGVSEFYYEASNTQIFFASDGASRIFAACPDLLLEYDVLRDAWFSTPHTRLMIGIGAPRFRSSLPAMVSGTMLFPSRVQLKPVPAVAPRIANATWLCMTSSKDEIRLVCPDERCWSATFSLQGCGWSLRAAERALGLVCLTPGHVPDKIAVASVEKKCVLELIPVDVPVFSRRGWFAAPDRYEPAKLEFVGLSMKRKRGDGYVVYLFYRELAELHAWIYDSIAKSWEKVGAACEVDPVSYGWHCAAAGSSSSSSSSSKVYLCSIEFYRSESGDRLPWKPPQSPVQLRRSSFANDNKLRLVAFDTDRNVWEDGILPRDGVVSPSDPDPNPSESRIRSTVLVCKDEQLIVAGRGREAGRGSETVHLWAMKPAGGSWSFEEIARAKAIAWGGAIAFATDGVDRVFVTVCESKESLEESRIMEYDLRERRWSVIPFDFDNKEPSDWMEEVIAF